MGDSVSNLNRSDKESYPWFTSGVSCSFRSYDQYSDNISEPTRQNNDYPAEFNRLFNAISLLNSRKYTLDNTKHMFPDNTNTRNINKPPCVYFRE